MMGQSTSEFCSKAHAQTIAKLNKSDMDRPLQKCLDMVYTVFILKTQVSEINLYIIGLKVMSEELHHLHNHKLITS